MRISYGKHYPAGECAVQHLYGPLGTWRTFDQGQLTYLYNYYPQWATPNHPYNRDQLVQLADGSTLTTCRDANGYLLGDYSHSGEVDPDFTGGAFHEHHGVGCCGTQVGPPFTQFWYDDNVCATQLAIAWDKPLPSGLPEQPAFVRWRPLSGSTRDWIPYNNSGYIDQLALDGLFWASADCLPLATDKLILILNKMQCTWDTTAHQYTYPAVCDTYHLPLAAILAMVLAHAWADRGRAWSDLLPTARQPASLQYSDLWQHYLSMRARLLETQTRDPSGTLCGWVGSFVSSTALANTETVALATIALSPMADYTLEATGADVPTPTTELLLAAPRKTFVSAKAGQDPAGPLGAPQTIALAGAAHCQEMTANFILRATPPAPAPSSPQILPQATPAVSGIVAGKQTSDFSTAACGAPVPAPSVDSCKGQGLYTSSFAQPCPASSSSSPSSLPAFVSSALSSLASGCLLEPLSSCFPGAASLQPLDALIHNPLLYEPLSQGPPLDRPLPQQMATASMRGARNAAAVLGAPVCIPQGHVPWQAAKLLAGENLGAAEGVEEPRRVCCLSVVRQVDGAVLAERDVCEDELQGRDWSCLRLPFTTAAGVGGGVTFRVHWYGEVSINFAVVRVNSRHTAQQ